MKTFDFEISNPRHFLLPGDPVSGGSLCQAVSFSESTDPDSGEMTAQIAYQTQDGTRGSIACGAFPGGYDAATDAVEALREDFIAA